jgi:predicted nucleic acid-binding Zn ribbon protein
MPKYKPTIEDIYPTKPCPICGIDILNEEETCSSMCQLVYDQYQKDCESDLIDWFDQMEEKYNNLKGKQI